MLERSQPEQEPLLVFGVARRSMLALQIALVQRRVAAARREADHDRREVWVECARFLEVARQAAARLGEHVGGAGEVAERADGGGAAQPVVGRIRSEERR